MTNTDAVREKAMPVIERTQCFCSIFMFNRKETLIDLKQKIE